jgi:hypothetical protein
MKFKATLEHHMVGMKAPTTASFACEIHLPPNHVVPVSHDNISFLNVGGQ